MKMNENPDPSLSKNMEKLKFGKVMAEILLYGTLAQRRLV